MIKIAATTHSLIALIMVGIDLIGGRFELALCHLVVSFLILINFLGTVLVVYWLTTKKTIALPLMIIILKYPTVIAAIVFLSKQDWISPFGIYSSVFCFVFSFVVAYFYLKARGQNAF
jgi:hypothetical protein